MQGGSIVDLTFGCPGAAARVSGWRVVEEVETLSDHRYIRYRVSTQTSNTRPPAPRENCPRWALKRLDKDLLTEAATVQAWISAPDNPADVDLEATSFRGALTQICDAAMPRVGRIPPRRQVYWWSDEIAQLRRACVAARRQYTRHRRRRRRRENDAAREAELYEAYREAKRSLKIAIAEAKTRARTEMLEELDSDPWGRAYRLARGKLRPYAPPLTCSLRPELLSRVLGTLFPPVVEEFVPPPMRPSQALDVPLPEDDGDVAVTNTELRLAVKKMTAKQTAPGPDGVPGKVLAIALEELAPRFRALLSACLERGQFPRIWRTGKLVLLRKEGRPLDSPGAYRPIVLLDEACKIFERIIAARLNQHLSSDGPDLADVQFGFRRERSTVHAILEVKALVEETVARGGVVLAVSLDIANAFNTLPWSVVREALSHHRVPTYLRRVIKAYLRDRSVVYPTREGQGHYDVTSGVPQGSVLGPVLWNIGYDWALRGGNLRGVGVTCYADDTLVTAKGKDYRSAALLATAGTAHMVGRIRRLGLRVALEKTEALYFHGPRQSPPPGAHLIVGGVRIEVGSTMKYLGLTLDSRLTFTAHFERLAPRLITAATALGRILPNLGGPTASCRRLYMGIVRSMALYGAPVWAEALNRQNTTVLRQTQRVVAVRAIRGYRTVAYEAACVLAGVPPWDLDARALSSLFQWREEARRRGDRPALREVEGRRQELCQVIRAEWAERLANPTAGHAIIAAILPVLNLWLDRGHGRLTFRVTQVLTGHGCFGQYLCHVARREPDTRCHHCPSVADTGRHTLEECPEWDVQRTELTTVVGRDLSLSTIIQAMTGDEASWTAVLRFCEAVMAAKEMAERDREITTDPIRVRRSGRRGRVHRDDLLPP